MYNRNVSESGLQTIAFNKTMTNASQGAKDFVKGTQNGTESLNNMTKASKAAELGMEALATVGNMALVFAITETISVIYECINASKNLQKAAAEAGSEFKSTKESIEDYRQKIADLHETINSSTASYEETYSAREELLKIQDEMIEKFGSEAESIDKIKEAIKGANKAFDELTQTEWYQVLNKFNADKGDGIAGRIGHFLTHNLGASSNMDKLMEEMNSATKTFKIPIQEGYEDFVDELKKVYGAGITEQSGNNVMGIAGDDISADIYGQSKYVWVDVSGENLKDVYNKMLDIQKLGKRMGMEDSFLDNLSSQLSDIQNKFDSYDEIYNRSIFENKIIPDKALFEKYNEIKQAYKDSQEIYKNGGSDEDVKAAQEKVAKLIQETTDGLTYQSVIDFFEEMYPDLQGVVGKWKFKVDFEANKDGFDDSIRDLISHFDSSDEIKKFNAQANPENVQYYDDLVAKATEYGLSVDQLIDKLEELGEIQSQRKIDLVDKLTSGKYSSEDKGQVNKFVNGLSEDDLKIAQTEDFDKALEEQKKNLNGATLSLENYQAALEKAKEANPTFTFKVDDLSKKIDEIQNAYKTLRDAIKEYNKEGYISVDTFQSIMALSPEYLKYLVDENGNLRLNEQALKDVAIARIQDMVVAQKIAVLDTAKTWTDEADALKYLKGTLDDASKSKEEFLNKQLKEVQLKWAEQTDENGNRKFSDKDIQENTKGILSVWSDIDTLGNSAINGINNGLGMTGESAKDVAKNTKDIKKIEFSKAKVFPKTVVFGKTFGNPLFLCFTGIEALFCFPKNAVPKNKFQILYVTGQTSLFSFRANSLSCCFCNYIALSVKFFIKIIPNEIIVSSDFLVSKMPSFLGFSNIQLFKKYKK